MFEFVPNGLLSSCTPLPTSEALEESSIAVETGEETIGANFASNGLLSTDLSGTTEKANGILSKSQNMDDSSIPISVSNGLLSSSNATADALADAASNSDEALLPEFSFVSNGLLSGASTVMTQEMTEGLSSTMTFVPNGLLSDSRVRSQDIDSSGAFASQNDDYFPPVHEVLGVPTGLISAPSKPSTSANINSSFSMRATTFDGQPVYFRRKPKIERTARDKLRSTTERMGNLLDVPIHRLMDQLSVKAVNDLQTRDGFSDASSSTRPVEETLWVDRYRPHRFTELMGNERVAREIMAWVKQWDWCVFGKRKGKKRARTGDENTEGMDEYHRPEQKLLLLSGPPGLGKTTMVHVIARQAGYEVMEINASDARSGSIIDDRIRPALESGAAVGSTKPVLLIIDEIDGATGAGDNSNTFISKLVSLTHDRPRKKRQKQKDHQDKRPILRPIICICNDINASSLAKLKPHALQIRIQRPADIHTVNRLREICEIEGLKADSRALSTLVGVAKGDLRGCLNTLQFIKSRSQEVTELIVRGATVGMKEADTSLNTVLNNIFAPLTKKRVKELALTEEEESRYVARLSHEIDASGRESSIALGCFGHYATLRQHDANFSRYEKANDWLVTFDTFSAGMYTTGDFAMSPYLPYTLVPFYPLFQERGGERVERNQADWENLQLTRQNEEILKTLSSCLRRASTFTGGDFRHLLSSPILQLEFVPLINRIISPPLRPVNSQIIKPEEKAVLTRLVNVMAALELRFFQERAEDGQLSYRLDPPIDVFVTYDGKRAADLSVSRYAVRHLVAGEIDALLIARDAAVVEKGKRGKHDTLAMLKKSQDVNAGDDHEDGPRSKRPRTDDAVDIADKPPTDFFGRVISAASVGGMKPSSKRGAEKKNRVSYRYIEGSSAAIRKPVKIGAFL
ncbi:hypothetical protein H0H92_005480 [Tricholoma furcatifolium]|nr:hypothetical protein H0H92_005480 [Tricholoma furcatifolium]